uniref:Uncharacterized protein n=1 Tax=Rousettus aegyptiacus TaxID=9407 RepID=A0A7J8KBL8_ROUAE|nr:hypothetical protein HJG63_008041 [Rousettus aegyptiacus]
MAKQTAGKKGSRGPIIYRSMRGRSFQTAVSSLSGPGDFQPVSPPPTPATDRLSRMKWIGTKAGQWPGDQNRDSGRSASRAAASGGSGGGSSSASSSSWGLRPLPRRRGALSSVSAVGLKARSGTSPPSPSASLRAARPATARESGTCRVSA